MHASETPLLPPIQPPLRAKAQRRGKGARAKDYTPNNFAVVVVLGVAGALVLLPILLWLAHITS